MENGIVKSTGICAFIMMLACVSAAAASDPAPAAGAPEFNVPGGPKVEITDIIARVAKRTGKQFNLDPRVAGSVPIAGLDLQRVDYPRLLAILRANGMAAYEANGVVNVVPDSVSRQIPIAVTTSVSTQTSDDELVTVVWNARSVCTAQLVPILRPLMPQAAHLAALPQTNSLILSDRADNARRILDLAERLEKQAASLKQNCTEPPYKSSN
jgi:general secretion pathway protein D